MANATIDNLYVENMDVQGVAVSVSLERVKPENDREFFILSSLAHNPAIDEVLKSHEVVLRYMSRERALRLAIILFETLITEYGNQSDDTAEWIIAGMRN